MSEADRKSEPAARTDGSKLAPKKDRSFSPDRKGESSAGALSSKDKEKAVAADRDGSSTR